MLRSVTLFLIPYGFLIYPLNIQSLTMMKFLHLRDHLRLCSRLRYPESVNQRHAMGAAVVGTGKGGNKFPEIATG